MPWRFYVTPNDVATLDVAVRNRSVANVLRRAERGRPYAAPRVS